MKLTRVQRMDSISLNEKDRTYFTDEGYLVDHPILTSCGIFEYTNPDGSIRRELRLPEHVFAKESLATYKGKPVIITHDAGVVDKSNVAEEQIGTILTEGYKDGDDVRAEIIIHNTEEMKRCDLKELSLGYNLTLDESPGTWNGEPYDAVQTNIVINHLALVGSARAGDQARLNIDSSEKEKTLKGGKAMSAATKSNKRHDGKAMSASELQKTIDSYMARKKARLAARHDEGDVFAEEKKPTASEVLSMVKDRRDRRDTEDTPQTVEGANGVIAQMDEDIQSLIEVLEEVLENEGAADNAEGDVEKQTLLDEDTLPATDTSSLPDDEENIDGEDCENGDGDDEENIDGEGESEEKTISTNADSLDQTIRQRLSVCRVGDKLGITGIEDMTLTAAKKAIIKKAMPAMHLDGKDRTYIDVAYDMAVSEVSKRKDVNYQRKQMSCNRKDQADGGRVSSAAEARKNMIARREGGTQ